MITKILKTLFAAALASTLAIGASTSAQAQQDQGGQQTQAAPAEQLPQQNPTLQNQASDNQASDNQGAQNSNQDSRWDEDRRPYASQRDQYGNDEANAPGAQVQMGPGGPNDSGPNANDSRNNDPRNNDPRNNDPRGNDPRDNDPQADNHDDGPRTAQSHYTHMSTEQLQQLVAPIALYPDSLVAQILAASAYPAQIVQAQRFLQENRDLKGHELAEEVDKQDWDPSVKALVQVPTVLGNLDKDLSWTSALGDANYNQQAEVMDAIQVMRKKAQDAGTLKTTPQQRVSNSDQRVTIRPNDDEEVYVPEYDPRLVYGYPVGLWPGFYPWWGVGGPYLSFGVGWGLGPFWGFGWGWGGWGLNWYGRGIIYGGRPYFYHSNGFYARAAYFHGNYRGYGSYYRGTAARGYAGRGYGGYGARGYAGTRYGGSSAGGTYNRGGYSAHSSGTASHSSGGAHASGGAHSSGGGGSRH